MYSLIRPFLFRLDPESAHRIAIQIISLAGKIPLMPAILRRFYAAPDYPVQAFGLNFKNPVGLAAGYDKDALGWRGLACLGFGHIEIGTVTLKPQPGNPKPRIFRLPEQQAMINRMGFPGEGGEVVAQRIAYKRPKGLVLGVNVGKNKDTPLDSAAQEYCELLKIFGPLADYLAVNVSSPNTVGLRRLQARDMLEDLLGRLAAERVLQEQKAGKKIPILVKLAPDMDDHELDDALTAIQDTGMDGVIATNTTLSREGVQAKASNEAGGLSGRPLTVRSREMVAKIVQRSGFRFPVIGVGGIMNQTDAQAMFDAGATLVQIYTGLIYSGPRLVQQILKEVP